MSNAAAERLAVPSSPREVVPRLRLPGWSWLLLGVFTLTMSSNRWALGLLGWIAVTPYLAFARTIRRWPGGLALLAVVIVGAVLQTLKVVTAPVSPALAFMFGVPGGLALGLLILLGEGIRRRLGEVWGVMVFGSVGALQDWVSFRFAEGGAWPSSASTQLDNLPLLQLASVTGITGIDFLCFAVSAVVAALLAASPRPWRLGLAALSALVLAHGWGAFRLDRLDLGPTLRVAGVVSHAGFDTDLARNTDELFARSELAAKRGAQVIVWNEVATVVTPAGEPELRRRGADFARRHGLDLVLAYGVSLSDRPKRFENKFEWFGPDGEVIETYRKHHPVPGEGSLRGDAPILVHARPWGRAAGAICYDYDFPQLGRQHAAGEAGLVVVPASDWRGIDPYHTLMARVRAIEGGFSVVRPVRWATSMAFDGYGRVRASLSAWEDNERVMLAVVPTRRVATLYSRLGDWPAFASVVLLLAAGSLALKKRPIVRRRPV